MPSDSVESFLDLARENRLLPSEQVQELVRRSEVPHENLPALCEALVTRGLLTAFQSKRIREGRGRELAFAGYPILDDLGADPRRGVQTSEVSSHDRGTEDRGQTQRQGLAHRQSGSLHRRGHRWRKGQVAGRPRSALALLVGMVLASDAARARQPGNRARHSHHRGGRKRHRRVLREARPGSVGEGRGLVHFQHLC